MGDERWKHAWLRISLRTLLWLMTVIAAFFGGFSVSERLSERRMAAVDQANKALEKEREVLRLSLESAAASAAVYQIESQVAAQKVENLEVINALLREEAKQGADDR